MVRRELLGMSRASALVLGLLCVSCSSSRPLVVAVPESPTSPVGWARPVSVIGYTTTDGRVYHIDGQMLDRGDTLVFSQVRRARGLGASPGRWRLSHAVPRDSIRTITVLTPEYSGPKTAVATVVGLALVVPLVYGIWVLSYIWSSN